MLVTILSFSVFTPYISYPVIAAEV